MDAKSKMMQSYLKDARKFAGLTSPRSDDESSEEKIQQKVGSNSSGSEDSSPKVPIKPVPKIVPKLVAPKIVPKIAPGLSRAPKKEKIVPKNELKEKLQVAKGLKYSKEDLNDLLGALNAKDFGYVLNSRSFPIRKADPRRRTPARRAGKVQIVPTKTEPIPQILFDIAKQLNIPKSMNIDQCSIERAGVRDGWYSESICGKGSGGKAVILNLTENITIHIMNDDGKMEPVYFTPDTYMVLDNVKARIPMTRAMLNPETETIEKKKDDYTRYTIIFRDIGL